MKKLIFVLLFIFLFFSGIITPSFPLSRDYRTVQAQSCQDDDDVCGNGCTVANDNDCKFVGVGKREMISPIGKYASQYSPWVLHRPGWESYVMYYCKNTVEDGVGRDRVWRTENLGNGKSESWVNDRIVIEGDLDQTDDLSCSPGVVISEDGTWHMYYVSAGRDSPMTLYLQHATAEAPGVDWEKQGLVKFSNFSQPFDYLETPSPLLVNGKIVLYFVAGGDQGLYRVESSDGYNFSEPRRVQAPLGAQGGRVTYHNNVYYYTYSLQPENMYLPPTETRLAVSVDGKKFMEKGAVMRSEGYGWDGDRLWSPHLIAVDSEYRIYYAGNVGSYQWWGSNTSIGLRWFRVRGSPEFTIAVLPDTQVYSLKNLDIFSEQTEWIRDQAQTRNIRFVLHEGDMTNNAMVEEWENAQKSMQNLDGLVPYVVLPGNHDYPGQDLTNRDTALFNQYFPVSKYQNEPTFGGVYEDGKLDNSYHLLSAGGIDWLIMGLEFGPRQGVIDWANNVIASYPDRQVVLVTHAYLYSDDKLHGSDPTHQWNPHGYPGAIDVHDGKEMWDELVKKHDNVLMVLNGHVLNDGTGMLVGVGDNGNKVYQMLANYQMGIYNGGDGYLRLLEFYPEQEKIEVKTYSPYLDNFLTAEDQEFTFTDVNFLTGDEDIDFRTVLSRYGSSDIEADQNKDGVVNGMDFGKKIR